jgi:hypothetical protein
MKTITICNSAKLFQQVLELKKDLESLGYNVLIHEGNVSINGKTIPVEEYNLMKKGEWNDEIQKTLTPRIQAHMDKITGSDAIVVMNNDKDGKQNYIGGNTLIEMGIAFYLKKPIFLVNPIPEYLPYVEEIRGVNPIILNNLEEIKKYL